jgi:putative proteasome-type protease
VIRTRQPRQILKCTLISFDSPIRSNISVGAPIDLLCYVRDSLRVDFRRSIDADDVYFRDIKRKWSDGAGVVCEVT